MRELDKARAYAESLIKFAPDPVFVSDLEGKILQANDAVSELLGFRPDEVIEQSLSRFISPEETREFTAALREVVAKGVTRNARLNPRSASGETIPTTLNASALRDPDGRVIGAIGILRDMRELDKAREAAEIANRAKSQFLANMSHELRTPLNAIILYTELLRDEATDRKLDDFLPDLKKIHGAAKHLLTLINDVLDLARVESGKLDLHPETFDVAGHDPGRGHHHPAARPEERQRPGGPLPGRRRDDARRPDQGPPEPVQPAVERLQVHRGRDGPAGGRAGRPGRRVAHLPGDRHRDRDDPRAPGQAVQAVLPGGPVGHPAVRRVRAGAGDHPPLLPGDGRGHRGREPARGRVHVHHPAAGRGRRGAAPRPPQSAGPAQLPARPRGDTVLVIDDDPATREVLGQFLTKKGFRVETAASGEEGLALARQLRPRGHHPRRGHARDGRVGGPRRPEGRPGHWPTSRSSC